MNDALAILGRYLDVLYDQVNSCPHCGTDCIDSDWRGDIEMKQWQLNDGRWYCYRCRATFDVYDYLDPDDSENAKVPAWR